MTIKVYRALDLCSFDPPPLARSLFHSPEQQQHTSSLLFRITATMTIETSSTQGPVLQEQPRPLSMENKKDSTIMDKTVEVVNKTVEVVEKGVNAVDPLHIFAPCIQPTRLVLKNRLYSSSNKAFPIVECRTGFSYHDLEATSTPENGLLVVKDTSIGKPVVVVERTGEKPDVEYEIFKTSPVHQGQAPAKNNQGQDLYALAKVERISPRDLQVLMNGETEPTCMIEKAGIPANYATNYFIKQPGVKEEVSSTHPWEGDCSMLVVHPGMDVPFMLCLGVIADDAEMSHSRKESLSEMAGKLNPRTLVRKLTSSSETDKK